MTDATGVLTGSDGRSAETPASLAGVDVGGRKTRDPRRDPTRPVARPSSRPPSATPDDAVDRSRRASTRRSRDAAATPADSRRSASASPAASTATRRVTLAVNLGWHDLPLGRRLEARLGLPVPIENDVRAAAAGPPRAPRPGRRRATSPTSASAPASRPASSSTASSTAASRGLAGEIGHVVLDPSGPVCQCGLRGCFEAVASGRAVARPGRGRPRGRRAELPRRAPAGHRRRRLPRGRGRRRPRPPDRRHRGPLRRPRRARAGHDLRRPARRARRRRDRRRRDVPGARSCAPSRSSGPRSELAREALPPDVVHLLPPDADAGAWGAVILARSAATVAAGRPEAAVIPGREVATG